MNHTTPSRAKAPQQKQPVEPLRQRLDRALRKVLAEEQDPRARAWLGKLLATDAAEGVSTGR